MGENEGKSKILNKILLIILLVLVISAVVLFVINPFGVEKSKETDANSIAKVEDNIEENSTNTNNEVTENTVSQEGNTAPPQTTTTTKETTLEDGIFSEYYTKAENLLKTMTLEEKVGQMFLARYSESGVINEIKTQNPGGYVLFSRDFDDKTKTSMLAEINNCQASSKIKMALAVDEEGGTVVRVSNHPAFRTTKFLSPQSLWQQGQLPLILEDSKEKSDLLKSIGLNMNLAPVVDVPTSSSDFIYQRAYGRGAEKTATYVSELIKTMNQSGMISTMKHFPGYGNNVDTHTGIAIDERPYTTFETSDFLPFKSGIGANGPTVLVSHNVVKCMDSEKPASLSEKVHKILREDLGFTGIVMTDDLAMDAVKSYVENGEAAVQAVLAGNDMIISSDFTKQKQEVVNAVNNGIIPKDLIDKAVKRILAWKYAYKII